MAEMFIIKFAKDIFFDDDEDNDIGEIDETWDDKIYDFAEVTVPNMSDRQFQMHFRLQPESFEILLQMLHEISNTEQVTVGQPKIVLEKEALLTLWALANLESFRTIANRFGISKSTCWASLYRTCHLLLKLNKHFKIICWPSEEKAMTIMNQFQTKHKIPGIVGVIDGSHIPIKAPRENHVSYINRKGYHSVLLQGVCDNNRLFIDVYAGEVGSIHDWTLFRRSDLYHRIRTNQIEFFNDSHLIGDLAYSLSNNLLVGFKDFGNLTLRQKNFNSHLNSARAVIENAFGLLKGRFRRLKSLETIKLDFISLLIVSACILHNICLMSGDALEDLLDIHAEIEEERRNNPHNIPDINVVGNENSGHIKRRNIVNALPLRNRR